MNLLISLILLASLKSLIYADINSLKWKNHVAKYGLKFENSQEETNAYNNYMKNDQIIAQHNSNKSSLSKLEHNEFSHWSADDHNKKHKGLIVANFTTLNSKKREIVYVLRGHNHTFSIFDSTPGYVPPASVDWVKAGWNTPVRRQLTCGDCYAFSTTGSIEAAYWMQNKTSVVLSPQQVTDCSLDYGDNGCNGGAVSTAYEYVIDNGLVEDQYYPFQSKLTQCNYNNVKSNNLYKISKFRMVKATNDAALMEAVAKFGPISVGINATNHNFYLYKSGLYDISSGCTNTINHGVVLTGYGTDENGNKYWTIKNQWGPNWGNSGYMNVSRNTINTCGISSFAFIPII